MRGWVRWIVGLALLALLPIVLRATLLRSKPVDVEVVPVASGLVEDTVTNSQAGTVKSRRRARVGAQRAGRIIALHHREGDFVAAGEPLIELDEESARAQLDAARRDVEAARASVTSLEAAARLAKQEYDRLAKLVADGIVSPSAHDEVKSRLERANAELEAARARRQSAQAAVRMHEEEVAQRQVRAPFPSVITQRFVEVGESVAPGQACLELMSLDSLYVSAPLDEVDIARIREGLPARISLDPFPGRSWMGRVSRVSPYVDDRLEQNRTLDVEVDVEREIVGTDTSAVATPVARRLEDWRDFRPGTSADIEVILESRSQVLRVPTFAVIEGRRVLVMERGKAIAREITVGLKNWEWTEVRSGLSGGEQVITNLDRQGVVEGARVAVAKGPSGGA